LRPYGLLVLETPDFGCEEFKMEGIYWKHVRPLEHIHMLNSKVILELLAKQCFKIIETTNPIPGKLAVYAEKL
jgi:hypothetical protein